MRVVTLLSAGLIASTADALVVTRATIEKCLTDAKVPVDTKGSEDWDEHVAPFNIRLPYLPTAISVPTTTKHIQDSVKCGKKLGIKVSAKSGGHSYASFGFGGENGHLVVELTDMYNVTYDAAKNLATVQPGARLGHVATVLYEQYGRAIAHGTCPGVGVSGHFLHGGFGFSSHMHGLAVDFIQSVDVVLADGSVKTASSTSNADLFWGLKGAGSNFGIVASYKLSTFAAPQTLTKFGVSLGWTKDTAVAGLEAVEKYAKNIQPREVNFRIGDYNKGQPGIEGLYYGTPAQWRTAFQPLLDTLPKGYTISEPQTLNWIQAVIAYSNYDEVDWIHPSPQENFYTKSLTLKGLNGTAAQAFVDYYFDVANKVVDRFWFFQLDMHGGKYSQVSKVPQDATAYAHRDKLYIIQFYDRYENNQTYPATSFGFLDGWVDAVTDTIPRSDWGAYINYADARLPRAEAVRQYYGEHLDELQALKAKYDPKQLFYYPQSVQPRA
ncbi:carbohydrate oxidase from Microdochium Nivale in complex with substrate analogue [Bimuria novae-zelandiae CBS 107.79]|uniref:Carbohydrate oxidase from Microdochium Nivale in complex with substrate analogue n=1 Tax=Bimuria novae-zelandiae CBS 107.79 TaxID=1447943 RepID=A0A6A5VUI9_9PLEO|nr:carbohydrate oxidase from Microdochium Nivale in complex with substrate analogue [Bimuria novae-zelandiae CBS 107.79]